MSAGAGARASQPEPEEALLYAARHGEAQVVRELLQARARAELRLDVSCKGKNKSNLGWTPLHLATYFGHVDVVAALLQAGADVNAANHLGDTPLHKAAFIGKEELVVLLLEYGADVGVFNGEGKLARDVCKTRDVHRLLAAAELAGQRAIEQRLLTAAKEGHLDVINQLLTHPQPPSINCVDEQGNTCLHCAAYRGHVQLAVILLQNGIDSSIRNKSGKLAVDLARDSQMRDVLSVQPVRKLQRTAVRFEGQLMRKSRFLGWRGVWAVLQRGVLVYYSSRAEAAAGDGRGRRDRKYLDGAKLTTPDREPALILVTFSDGDSHRLAVPPGKDVDVKAVRQTWITAFNEHIAYSGHYLWAGSGNAPCSAKEALEGDLDNNDDDECRPLGSMQDALTNASNSLALLDSQLKECAAIMTALDKSIQIGSTLHQSAYMRFQHVYSTGQRSLGLLRHCCALVTQSRETDASRLRAECEKNRVLEQALAALAREHHELEMSVQEELGVKKKTKKKRNAQPSTTDFYDPYDDSDSDTLVTAGLNSPLGALSPWGNSPEGTPTGARTPNDPGDRTPTGVESPEAVRSRLMRSCDAVSSMESLHSALSAASSLGTLVSHDGHVYRNARSHVGLYRASSQWSI